MGSGIISGEWQLARPAISNARETYMAFTNGITITAELNQIVFSENLKAKTPDEMKIPEMARQYVETLPNLDYQVVGISPSGFFTFEEKSEDAARHYIVTRLLAPGSWQESSKEPLRASIQLAFILEQGQFNLKIDDVKLRLADNTPQSAVLFEGSFLYEITGNTASERQQHLYQLIDNWPRDLKSYREIVNGQILGLTSEV